MKQSLKLLAFFLSLFLATTAIAQSVATADMHVSVRDPKGAAITNAKVTVSDPSKGFERTVTTNLDGEYSVLQLPPGTYSVAIEAPGFAKLVAESVNVTVGQSAQIPVTLQVAAASETVTVSTAAEMVETQRTSSTTTIEEKRIENLPINGRNYINFTLTNSQATRDVAPSIGAAPTSGINFGGQRARSNLVNVDGVDAEDNSVNGIRSTVSQDAVQEFQIITNSYNPEYGRASGGVVNIITKSGSNDFHGSAFGYLRNRHIQAVNPFSTVPDPAYTRVQAGFTAGGALQKDKTWYFLSYETTRRQETGFSTIGADNFGLVPLPNAALFGLPPTALVTPDQAAFLGAVGPNPATVGYAQLAAGSAGVALEGTPGSLTPLGFFPESALLGFPIPLPASFQALVPQIGNFPVSEGTTLVSARLDHKFNDHNTGLLRVNVSPSTVTGIEVNAQNQNFGQNGFSRTSIQSYRDFAITGQDTVEIGNNIINEGRFSYGRRGLLYNFNNKSPFGTDPAVNIVGFAFVGREPFSSLRREEQRWQLADNVSWLKGNHSIKFGVDVNYVPVKAAFQVNFGGVYNFGGLDPTTVSSFFSGFPSFSPVQAYGLGLPTTYVQGIGNPNAKFNNFPIGAFIQDSWRIKPNLTLNYGLRYDIEIAPSFGFNNQLSADAYNALGIQKGFKTDTNNFAPRIGIAWDPWNNGKTVVRASFGMFYDHPLLGLIFLGEATDGVGTPQALLFIGPPCDGSAPGSPFNLNATNVFMGTLTNANCLPSAAAFGYLPNQQKFDPFFPNSLWINQNFLSAGFPLINQPFGFPTGKNFQYAYSEQANLSVERDLGGGFALSVAYNFNGGHHLNRPINANPVHQDLLVANWERAVAAAMAAGIPQTSPLFPSNPLFVNICPTALGGLQPAGLYAPAAMLNFFRPSGLNPSLAGGPCLGDALALQAQDNLGLGVPVPFSDMTANFSNGSSVYHGLTTNLRKRFTKHYEFLASYTWSHTIDDSTDLQSLLSPQDSFLPQAERSNSTFDQRHRFVFSAVYQSGHLSGDGFGSKFFSYWTVAPIIEYDSGRPFTILTADPANFQFAPNSARPNAVPAGTGTNACGFAPVASSFSPTGFFQVPCFIDADAAAALATSNPALLDGISSADMNGNVGRNSAVKPSDVFTDLRISRLFHLGERVQLEGIVDMFNLINKFNVADVNPLFTNAGQPSAAFDPRQFQFALRLTW